MLHRVHLRGLLAGTLAVLLLAPMAAGLMTPCPQPSCCQEPASRMPQPANPCCAIRGQAATAPAVVSTASPAGHDQVIAVVTTVAAENLPQQEWVPNGQVTTSPPIAEQCSPVLRV